MTCEIELENLPFAYDVRDSRPGRRKRVLGPDEAAAKKVPIWRKIASESVANVRLGKFRTTIMTKRGRRDSYA